MKTATSDTTSISTRQFLIRRLRASLADDETPLSNTPLEKEMDWDLLLQFAAFHRVTPLLYRTLRNSGPQAVPASVLAGLAAYVRSTASRSLLLTGELLRLLKRLEAQGIAAIPFKGPALAVTLYGDPALRHFDDLDILVRQEDFSNAKSIILSLGYQPREQHSHHESFKLARGSIEIVVELHWHIMIMPEVFPLTLNLKEIWERCESFSFAGAKVMTLAPEDLLLFLCVHGSRHLWLRLQWICDVAQLIRRYPSLDWGWVMEQARITGGQRMLFLGIYLANDILGAPLPSEIEQKVCRDPQVAKLAQRVRWQLFAGTLVIVKPWKETLFPLQLIDRLPDRIAYLPRRWFYQLFNRSHHSKTSEV